MLVISVSHEIRPESILRYLKEILTVLNKNTDCFCLNVIVNSVLPLPPLMSVLTLPTFSNLAPNQSEEFTVLSSANIALIPPTDLGSGARFENI